MSNSIIIGKIADISDIGLEDEHASIIYFSVEGHNDCTFMMNADTYNVTKEIMRKGNTVRLSGNLICHEPFLFVDEILEDENNFENNLKLGHGRICLKARIKSMDLARTQKLATAVSVRLKCLPYIDVEFYFDTGNPLKDRYQVGTNIIITGKYNFKRPTFYVEDVHLIKD